MTEHTPGSFYHSAPRKGKLEGHEVRVASDQPGFSRLICQGSHHPSDQAEAKANMILFAAAPETAARAHDLANQVMTLEAEKARLVAALEEIAGNQLSMEMSADDKESGCWVDGFDMCVETARAAIAANQMKS